jgi:hypothetical protein
LPATFINYTCADGRFPITARGVTISKTPFLAGSEKADINSGMKES